MKTFVLFIAFYYLPIHSICQSSLIEAYNNHQFPCDNESGTSRANICSGIKTQFVDSLMNKLYYKILKSINEEIARNNLVLKREKLASKDSTKAQLALKQRDYYLRMKQTIINSQHQWIRLRDLNSKVEAIFCEGGTGCSAIVNEAYIEDTLDRIIKLESFNVLG